MFLLKVFWTKTAVAQRNNIFEYWNRRNCSNTYSSKLRLIINKNIELLRKYPELGVITDYGEHRTLAIGNFNLFYKFNEECIIITAFWDNHQDPNKLLKILKNETNNN